MLLHVIDYVDEERHRNVEQVSEVLKEIGAEDIPQLLVYNKIDLVEGFKPKIERNSDGRPVAVWLSAQENSGIEFLLEAIVDLLSDDVIHTRIKLKPSSGRLRAKLYKNNAVLNESFLQDGSSELEIRIPFVDLNRILASEDLQMRDLDCVDNPSNWQKLAV